MASQEEHFILGTVAEAQCRRHLHDVGYAGTYYLWPLQEAYVAAREYWDAILARDLTAHPAAMDDWQRMLATMQLFKRWGINPVFVGYSYARALYQDSRDKDHPIPYPEVQKLANDLLQKLRAEALRH